MKKPYLLIAGDNQYPEAGTVDWKGCFATEEEAKAAVTKHEQVVQPKGKNSKITRKIVFTHYTVAGYEGVIFDWYEIVDLRDWVE